MKFSKYDTRHYPMLGVQDGDGEWAEQYESAVLDEMDCRLPFEGTT